MKLPKLLTAIAFTGVLGAALMHAQSEDARIATAWRHEFNTQTMMADVNFVTFPFANPINITKGTPLSLPEHYNIDQPVRVGNYYYFYTFAQQIYGYDAGGFYRFDIEENNIKQIADYGGQPSGTAFSNLCYDYTDGTMYCTDGYMGGTSLAVIDLETGLHKKTCKLNVPLDMDHPYFADYLTTIAINYDGEMYGLTYWGNIVKINKFTGECKVIAKMDYNPDYAFMYSAANRMFFDNETGDCYLHLWTYANRTEIRKLDLATGHSEQFAPYPSETGTESLYGIYLPFTAAEPSAPGQVTNLSVTAADKGVLKAILSWTNPTKTYGRGGTLEELDKIEIYRNGELIHTIDNPTIGGKETYTDLPENNDYYTYRVVGYNDSGRGDRACASAYVGIGIPQMPQDVTIAANGDDVKVTWTMPELGSFDAYIDYNDVVYDIVRYEGINNLIETKVAEGISEKEFTDTPDHLGRYFYGVTARNSAGTSESGNSEKLICGPAIRVPNTFNFNDENANQTWTIIDGNGDGDSWKAEQNGPWTFVMNSKFNIYAGYAAMEYLISPKTHLEKDKRYKVTFTATPGSDKILEVLAVSFGKQPTPQAQDSVTQYNISSKQGVSLRANLPIVKESGSYHFGFVHRTAVANYSLSLSNISISEDHEGYAKVSVVDEAGNPIPGATVTAPGVDPATADKDGTYILNYLPQGTNTVSVSAHGYFDGSGTVEIKEWEITPVRITLSKRQQYTLSGTVKDAAGDPIKEANVMTNGYDEYTVLTDDEGRFEITGIYEANGYGISISKNRHVAYSSYTDINADLNLGEVVLADNTRSPRTITATEDSQTANVSWTKPANDDVSLRFDDGGGTQLVGLGSGTTNSVFGTVFRTPATVKGTQFYLGSLPGINHWNVQLYIFDLDEQGNPTNKILYHNTYVSVTDDEWNSYTLPYPVEAPRGFYMAIAADGNVCIGVDGNGDSAKYPFKENTNFFTQDYTSGKFNTLESAGISHNFQMRAFASPYDDADMPKFIRKAPAAETSAYEGEPLVITPIEANTPAKAPAAPAKVLEDRLRYNLYRLAEGQEDKPEEWTAVAKEIKSENFSDTDWKDVEKGIYKYAVSAVYADGVTSEPKFSDIVGRDMHTDVKFNIFTNTDTNISAGAKLSMTSSDTRFHYEAEADETGRIMLPYVWKGIYSMTITKDGFDPWTYQTQIGDEQEYIFSATLKETKYNPVGLRVIDDGIIPDSRLLAWNFPELLKESFEQYQGHPAFTINSPGYLNWSYIDGDNAPTGGLNYEWPNRFEPMSWMVFNPDKTTPSMLADNLMPYPADGEQFILAVSSGNIANDDYIISPRLFFDKPFSLQFEAAGWNPQAEAETIQVGYSLSDTDPESFVWYTPVELEGQKWNTFTYNELPATTRYIAIRYISSGLYMAMVDNIKIGDPSHITDDEYGYYTPSYTVPTGNFSYEIILNGNKIATTNNTTYELTALPIGHHVAAVRGVYASGYSDAASVEFDITQTGIENVTAQACKVRLRDRQLSIEGACDRVDLVTPTGILMPLVGHGCYDLSAYQPGIYFVRVQACGKQILHKVVLK